VRIQEWINEVGYRANIRSLARFDVPLTSFASWLDRHSREIEVHSDAATPMRTPQAEFIAKSGRGAAKLEEQGRGIVRIRIGRRGQAYRRTYIRACVSMVHIRKIVIDLVEVGRGQAQNRSWGPS
jgi:hypothetical protein